MKITNHPSDDRTNRCPFGHGKLAPLPKEPVYGGVTPSDIKTEKHQILRELLTPLLKRFVDEAAASGGTVVMPQPEMLRGDWTRACDRFAEAFRGAFSKTLNEFITELEGSSSEEGATYARLTEIQSGPRVLSAQTLIQAGFGTMAEFLNTATIALPHLLTELPPGAHPIDRKVLWESIATLAFSRAALHLDGHSEVEERKLARIPHEVRGDVQIYSGNSQD